MMMMSMWLIDWFLGICQYDPDNSDGDGGDVVMYFLE